MAVLHEVEQKKEYLLSYQKAKQQEEKIIKEIQELKADYSLHSVVIDGIPKGSCHKDLSDYVVQIDSKIEELKLARLNRIIIYKNIYNQIDKINDEDEKDVLRLRYLWCLPLDQIANKIEYSLRTVFRIHGKALQDFEY